MNEPSPIVRRRLSRNAFILALLLGALGGMGAYTMQYASGLSYMSNNPTACKNCHIMNEQFDSWQKGGHRAVAVCNDCHVPTDLVGKYLAKASNGYHHSKGFTFQDFHEPVMIKPGNSQILQDNCVRCHGDFVHEIVRGSTSGPNAVRCVHCHRGVGHGARR